MLVVEGVVGLKVIDLRCAHGSYDPQRERHEGGRKSNLWAESHLHKEKKYIDITRGRRRSATDRDGILERTLGIYKIPLDDRIRRLELTELGVVRFAKQILRDRGQGLR